MEINEAGLYDYNYLDYYWIEEGRYPYMITVDGKLAGFSFIKVDSETSTFDVAEFFILRSYRKMGVGKALIDHMFFLHKGKWTIDTHMKNITAQKFWRSAVKNNAVGGFSETIIQDGRRMKWSFTNI